MSMAPDNPIGTSPTSEMPPPDVEHVQQCGQALELCIYTCYVGLYRQPPENIRDIIDAESTMITDAPPDSVAPGQLTCLLRGDPNEFRYYSHEEHSNWLIEIAHDLCDPVRKRGSLYMWDVTGPTSMWRTVNPTESLMAALYLYNVCAVVSLTRISHRTAASTTTASGAATTMKEHVNARDRHCWVSGSVRPTTNSHICPVRMGDHLLHVIYSRFVSTAPPRNLSIYHEMCGITLSWNLDGYFDVYEFGLRFVTTVVTSEGPTV